MGFVCICVDSSADGPPGPFLHCCYRASLSLTCGGGTWDYVLSSAFYIWLCWSAWCTSTHFCYLSRLPWTATLICSLSATPSIRCHLQTCWQCTLPHCPGCWIYLIISVPTYHCFWDGWLFEVHQHFMKMVWVVSLYHHGRLWVVCARRRV